MVYGLHICLCWCFSSYYLLTNIDSDSRNETVSVVISGCDACIIIHNIIIHNICEQSLKSDHICPDTDYSDRINNVYRTHNPTSWVSSVGIDRQQKSSIFINDQLSNVVTTNAYIYTWSTVWSTLSMSLSLTKVHTHAHTYTHTHTHTHRDNVNRLTWIQRNIRLY